MNTKLLFLIFFLFVLSRSGAQNEHYVKGNLTDALVVSSDTTETYAVYLPSYYTTEKKWPVVYVFDPSGKGKEAAMHFVGAAEKYGYILIASNAIRNGDYHANFRKISSLMNEVRSQLSIDENRIVFSGFSGMARLAVSSAVLSKNISAVIGCGAAFEFIGQFVPKQNTFMYVGIIGNEDFNYMEMINGYYYLKERKFDVELLETGDGHKWPEPIYIEKALRTLTLKYLLKGTVAGDKNKLKEFYREDLEYAGQLYKKGDLEYAYDAYEEMQNNYRSLGEVEDGLKAKLKEIRKNKLYKTQLSESNRTYEIESLYRDDYNDFLPDDVARGDTEALAYWHEEIAKLNEIQKSPKPATRKMATRLKNYLEVLVDGYREALKKEKEKYTDSLLFIGILTTILQPERESSYLEVIKLASNKGDYGMALFYLEELLKQGYNNTETLDKLEGTALLRISTEYKELLEKYKLQTRY